MTHPFMMLLGTSLSSDQALPTLDKDPSPDCQTDTPSPAHPPQSSVSWVTRVQCDLARAEGELQQIQDRYAEETEIVKRGVERTILGARREEQRLLERVEQDHRDTQQHLEMIQRENMAAARVCQSLMDQRFHKLSDLQQRIQEVGQSALNESGSNHNTLLKEIAEFLQPWEISVSLKKVHFKPSSQPNAVTFGEIRVQEQSLSLNVGGCGPHGQLCALHSREMKSEDINHQGFRREKATQGQGWTSPAGRVVRKISLSNHSDLEPKQQQKLSSEKICHWLPKCEQSDCESSQHAEMESGSFQPQEEDIFLTVPMVLENIDGEGKDQLYKRNCNGQHYLPRNQNKLLSVASSRKLSSSPERWGEETKLSHCSSLEIQDVEKRKVIQDSNGRLLRYCNSNVTSPRMTPRDPLASKSCLDLTSRHRPQSCLSQSSDEQSLGTLGDSGRAPSPTDSLDSSYTFIVGPSHDQRVNKGSLNYSCRLSKSAVDLTHKTRPLISSGTSEQSSWKVKYSNFSSILSSTPASPALGRRSGVFDRGQTISCPAYRGHSVLPEPHKKAPMTGSKQAPVTRSLSMSMIDHSSQDPKRGRAEKGEPTLVELEEGDPSFTIFNPRDGQLIRQFGKQGSGRADFTLPSGIHATSQGQLFIVDCGNARIQVTDPRGNVLQQVTSPNADGSARRCRNYFDIAVNAKGLIALSCAAERALLVFNRHGRLLQTFGGSGSGSAKDELEAPRGVTVTRLDEFLVADIRKGSLIALKLEPKTGSRYERTVVTGFHRPYLVAACLSSGMVAVSERGNETGYVPCIKVLEPGWNTVSVLGVCAGMGPVLTCPWGICIDADGNILVADWGEQHKIVVYPEKGVGWPIVTQGLSSPRGLTLLPDGHLAVSDSMHHCIKIYQYKMPQEGFEL